MQRHFPSTVTSPTQQFQLVRVLVDIDGGTLEIRAKSGKTLKEAVGQFTPTATGWTMVSDEGSWTITRDKKRGCNCGASKIVELQSP